MPIVVSFVIPVKNDMQRLRHCLSSIVANDYPRDLVEIIVVDNDSTDGSAEAAANYGANILRCSSRRVAELRNRGAREARGTIIAFADADHEIDRRWILTAVDVLSLPGVAATGSVCLTEPSPNWVQQHYDGLRVRASRREEVMWLGSGNLAVSRVAFESIGGFNIALTACEDVDLCNRLRHAGHRIVADPALRSVHFGDPKSLKALFYGELWRGRDNLKVTLSGPKTFRHLRSALLPIANLLALVAGSLSLLAGRPGLALMFSMAMLGPAVIKAALIIRRRFRPTLVAAAQALVVVLVFDVARALALLIRGSHGARRAT